VVTRFGSGIAADIAVRDYRSIFLVINVVGSGNMADLLAQGSGSDFHAFLHPGHTVDDIGVRTGDVDHDRRIDPGSTLQRNAGHPVVFFADVDHFGIKHKRCAFGFGRALEVVGGKLRIVDIARLGKKNSPFHGLAGGLSKIGVIGQLHRKVLAGI
jgi:hypothetical protein